MTCWPGRGGCCWVGCRGTGRPGRRVPRRGPSWAGRRVWRGSRGWVPRRTGSRVGGRVCGRDRRRIGRWGRRGARGTERWVARYKNRGARGSRRDARRGCPARRRGRGLDGLDGALPAGRGAQVLDHGIGTERGPATILRNPDVVTAAEPATDERLVSAADKREGLSHGVVGRVSALDQSVPAGRRAHLNTEKRAQHCITRNQSHSIARAISK